MPAEWEKSIKLATRHFTGRSLKVLPDHLAADADRLARFQREAHVLAALNHPNIAAIYGLEQTGDVKALVLELAERLRERFYASH